METKKVPPITLGIDMLSDETAIPKGAVREATNIDINRAGQFARRKGYARVVAGAGWHSLRTFPQQGLVLAVQNSTLKALNPTTYSTVDLFTLNSPDRVDYCEHNGNIYFSNRTTIGWIPAGSSTARRLGVPYPDAPTLSATAGNLTAGKYSVGLTYVDDLGEESGLSDLVSIDLPNGGGIALTMMQAPAGYKTRVYVSPPDGENVYLNQEFTSATTGAIRDNTRLKQGEGVALYPMVPGSFVRAFNGRLITGEGDALTFSEPLRYGAVALGYSKIKMNGAITFIEPVLGGVFVGAGTRVWFLAGGDISKAELRMVSGCKAIPCSSISIPAEHLPEKLVQTDYPVALWLSTSGYVVGLPDGQVKELQPDRARIPSTHAGRSVFLLRNGLKQVVTPVNSNIAAAYGTAVDSSTL